MARLSKVAPEAATGKVKALYGRVEGALGLVPNMVQTMAVSPAVAEGWFALNGALSTGSLGAALGEKLALGVGEANRCDYCLSAHTAIGRSIGVSDGELEASRRLESPSAKEAAALRLAAQIVDARGAVTDEQLEVARDAGLSDGDIAEVVGHVVLNVFTNYFNRLARTEIEFPVVRSFQQEAA